MDQLLNRGVANIIPGRESLEKLLMGQEKLHVYLGIDPTSPRIHLGHCVSLRKLQAFSQLGHDVTFLIGDFTALIGDTSDKESERPVLTSEEIEENFKYYKKQAEKIVDFSKVSIRHNSEWLASLTFTQIIRLTQQFSLNDFISRELIKKRLNAGSHVRLDETLYPLMQGFDSYQMNTDVQIGGTDQTFNMQAGRTLAKTLRSKESYVLATEFLMGTDGRKMSKTWGNAIWLDDTPEDIYAKVMSISDNLICQYYTLATNVPPDQIREAAFALEKGENPMAIKKELAFAVVEGLLGLNQAERAKLHFEKTVQRKEVPQKIDSISISSVPAGTKLKLSDILLQADIVTSRLEAKRLIEQKGIKINNAVVTDDEITIEKLPILVQIGKRKFYRIVA
jgi:tyrosyl-tRNA synthetase